MLTQLSYIGARLAPLLWIAAAFGFYLTVALVGTLVSGSATVASAVAYVAIFIAVVLWRRARPAWVRLPATGPPRRSEHSFWSLVVLSLISCWITGQLAASWVYRNLGSAQYEQSVAAQAETPLLLLMVSAIVLAPVGEEALLRGVAYPMVRKLFTPMIAAVVTSTVFALIHGNLVQIMVAIPLGVLLAFVYERTQRLMPVIVLHAFFNALAMLAPAPLVAGFANLPLIILSLAVSLLGLWCLRPPAVVKSQASRDAVGVGGHS